MSTTDKTCAYCGRKTSDNVCGSCGSCEFETPQPWWSTLKSEPYFYNGYIVWTLYDMTHTACSFYFYLGDRLVDIIRVEKDVYDHFVPRYEDGMWFVWDLFKLSQGEEEVLRVQEQNAVKPAVFEIRRSKTEREEWLEGLTVREYWQAVLDGKVT